MVVVVLLGGRGWRSDRQGRWQLRGRKRSMELVVRIELRVVEMGEMVLVASLWRKQMRRVEVCRVATSGIGVGVGIGKAQQLLLVNAGQQLLVVVGARRISAPLR